MFRKRACAALLAAVMSISAGYTVSADGYSQWVGYITEAGGTEIWDGIGYEKNMYDPSTGTLTFTEDMTLYGSDYNIGGNCGSAIISEGTGKDLTIELAGHDVKIDAEEYTASWIGGIYRNGGSLTIKGPGSLTVTASGGTAENAALMGYNGADISVTGGAKVILSDADDNGYGLWASGQVYIDGGSVLEMNGGGGAVKMMNRGSVDPGENIVTVGSSADTASEWNGMDDLAAFKYIRIGPPRSEDALGVWVGGMPFSEAVPTHTFGGVTASYNAASETLTLDGTGVIQGSFEPDGSYGAAIYAEHSINIVVNGTVDLIGARNENGIYSYGIYTDHVKHGRITIGGCGTLRVIADSSVSGECAAIAAYTGADAGGNADETNAVVIRDGVTVYAEAEGARQFGVFTSTSQGSGYGRIYVSENSRLYASGGRSALYAADAAGLVWDTKKITVTDENHAAAEFDETKLNTYRTFSSEPLHDGSAALVRLNTETWSDDSSLAAVAESGKVSSIDHEFGCELDGENIGFNISENIAFPGDPDSKFKNASECAVFDVDIRYYDEGMGGFYFQYDSYDGIKNIFVQCEDTNTWKYARIRLYDAKFSGGANGYDCRIVTADEDLFPYAEGNKSPEPVHVYWLRIYSNEKYSPFDINADSVKPGNVFYEGERVKFDVSFMNTDGAEYKNMRVTYSIYEPESNDMYAQWEETENISFIGNAAAYSEAVPVASKTQYALFTDKDAKDTVVFEGIPFGTYVLKIDMTADSQDKHEAVQMSSLTDLAYSKKAEPNLNIGANAHYDDYYSDNGEFAYLYDEKDIDDQIALARDAGFGIMRSTVRWWNVKEGPSAPYSMPETIEYAYKELADNGMSGLCQIMQDNSLGFGSRWDGTDVLGDTEEEIKEFGEYAGFVAKELSPYTKYFSLLNEFDRCENGAVGLSGDYYDAPTAEIYADLVKAGSDAIKSVRCDAWINAGCISQDPAWQFEGYKGKYTWDTRFLKTLDESAVDSVSFQRYSYRAYGPEGIDLTGMPEYGSMLLDEYAQDAKLWITEIGYPARDRALYLGGASGAFNNTTYQRQAEYMPRLLAMYAGGDPVDTLIIYEFQDDREDPFSCEANYGLVHSKFYRTPWAAKPSYVSVAAFNSITGHTVSSESLGAEIIHTTNSQDHFSFHPIVYKLTNDEGQETYCVWSTRDTDSYTVETGKQYAVVYDLYGNILETDEDGTVTVSAEPDIKYVVGYDELPVPPEPADPTDPEGPSESEEPEDKTELYAEKDGIELEDLSAVTDGDEIVVHYTQDSSETQDCTIICAAYNDNVLTGVLGIDTESYTTGGKTMKINIQSVNRFDEIRLFAWGIDQKPKIECVSLRK